MAAEERGVCEWNEGRVEEKEVRRKRELKRKKERKEERKGEGEEGRVP